VITMLAAIGRHRSWYSAYSLISVGSLFSAFSVLSIGSAGSILCIGSAGSMLSIGAADKRRGEERRN
jgi:hypothetical protein